MSLGVKISTSDAALAKQFKNAMNFWSEVLDLDWHEVNTEDCAVQLVDGTPALFDFCSRLSAKAHLPDRSAFQGWIAFNPALKLSERQMFMDSVHEIGHLLGLTHNTRTSSIMYYLQDDKPASLDAADLEALTLRHQLRRPTKKDVRVSVPKQLTGL